MDDRHQVPPYPLRMSAELRKRLEDEARAVGRSLNAEIVTRLEASLGGEAGLSDLDKKFLLGLVGALKQTRETAGPQLDLFIDKPDGTRAVVEVKSYPQPDFPGIDADRPTAAPTRRRNEQP